MYRKLLAEVRLAERLTLPCLVLVRHVQQLETFVRQLEREAGPGTPVGDCVIALSGDRPDEERTAAMERLSRQHFPRGAIFHSRRWPAGGALDRAFAEWRGSQDYNTAWSSLTAPIVLDAFDTEDASIRRWFQMMRNCIRNAVEKELLGRTLRSRDPVLKLCEETQPWSSDFTVGVDLRVDLTESLGQLSATELEAILTEGGAGATRVARHRARKRLRKLFEISK